MSDSSDQLGAGSVKASIGETVRQKVKAMLPWYAGSVKTSIGETVRQKVKAMLPWYTFSVQFRMVYWSIIVISALATLTIGACVQGFAAGLYSDASTNDFMVCFVGVPVIFFWLSLLIDQAVSNGFDSNDTVQSLQPFVCLRSFAVAAGLSNGAAQILILMIMELPPLIYVLKAAAEDNVQILGQVFRHYTHGGLVSVCLLAGLLILLKVTAFAKGRNVRLVAIKDELRKNPFLVFDSALAETTNEQLDEEAVKPVPATSEGGEDNSKPEADVEPLSPREGANAKKTQPDEGIAPLRTRLRSLIVCFISAALLLVVAYLVASLTQIVWLSFVLLVAALVCNWCGVETFFPRLLGRTYLVILVFYVILCVSNVVFAFTGVLASDDKSEDRILLGSFDEGHPESPGPKIATPSGSDGYPVCSMRWGTAANDTQLNIFDFTILAEAVYGKKKEIVRNRLHMAFKNTTLHDYAIEEIQDWTAMARYVVINFPAAKKRVIAIRGTQIADEGLADLDMMAPAAILDFVHQFVPIDSLLPKHIIRWYFEYFNLKLWFGGKLTYQKHLDAAMHWKQVSDSEGAELFVTGHSLGGVLSAIISGRTGIKGVAFSPPGTEFMLNRYGVKAESLLWGTYTAVIPERDLVVKIDGQIGTMAPIECPRPAKNCHDTSASMCELFDRCGGDPRGRQLSKKTTEEYNWHKWLRTQKGQK